MWYRIPMNPPLIIAFGSQVSGNSRSGSDFDFAVQSSQSREPLTLEQRTDIAESLAMQFSINEDKIDLVDLSSASPLLKFEISRKGKLIQGSTFDFTRFKVRAFKEYTDTAKFRMVRELRMLKNHV